ncbi:MAG: T9SS type A sorting domain-containing protein [Sphingobacteriales bacterium]|nr:MAG: T9SS type A sorting domain-containing protein [Sphingobacteriales bacterium]
MRKYLLALSCCLFSFVIGKAQIPQAYADRLQVVLDSVASFYNMKGVSAAVTVPGLGTWAGVYGISEDGVPMDTAMALGIGSNTKTFVSAQLLKLDEQGLLSIDDSIGNWIQHPNVNPQITLRQLLNHSSGVYSFTNSQPWSDSMTSDFNRAWTPDEILQFIDVPDFAPGAGWNYSNSNYLLLGLVIRDVTGQPLAQVLRNGILNPAGLTRTWLYPEETVAATVPHVWSRAFNGVFLEDIVDVHNYSNSSMFSMAWAAGGIMSTASDNAIFWSKLIREEILSPAALLKMKEVIQLTPTRAYGLGIFRLKNFNGRTVYSHGGTNLGFINENIADSISGVGISVLTNQDSVSNSIISTRLVAALHKVTINPPLSVGDLAAAARLQIYPNPASGNISISGVPSGLQVKLELFDMTGRLVFGQESNQATNITLPELQKGMYLVRVTGEAFRGSGMVQVVR